LVVDPNPGSSVPVVVEVSPEAPCSALGQSPAPVSPSFNFSRLEAIHVIKEVAIMELSKLGIESVVIFTNFISSNVAVQSQSLEGISHQQDTSSPWVVKATVLVAGILGIIWLVEIVRSIKRFMVENAKKWKSGGAWSITIFGVAALACHLAYPMILFAWPL